MDRRRACGNCEKAGAGFCAGFFKQLVEIIKKYCAATDFGFPQLRQFPQGFPFRSFLSFLLLFSFFVEMEGGLAGFRFRLIFTGTLRPATN